MFDWIDTFVDFTTDKGSPELFRVWTGITTISAVMERYVWTETDKGDLYPNMFTILAGAPASGKSLMVNESRKLLVGVQDLGLGPDNPTKASFMDSLAKCIGIDPVTGDMATHMVVLCREFGLLISKHDHAFLADLTDLYDCPPIYNAPRRTSVSVSLDKPSINVLAAVTPDFLGDLMPESAWGQGFTSRLIFIYGAKTNGVIRNVFSRRKGIDMAMLTRKLIEWRNELRGAFEWDEDAQVAFNNWYNSGMMPVPDYGRLVNYAGRRDAHALKLCMISAISAGRGLNVTLTDFNRAKSWLLAAEEQMPNVFRAMVQKSDGQLIADLHQHIYSAWASQPRDKRLPIGEVELYKFLENRAPSERIPHLIALAERGGRIRKGIIPGTWVPRPMGEGAEV